ncbi:MAG: amidohydrolase family protein [Acidimicrobiia bacterium]
MRTPIPPLLSIRSTDEYDPMPWRRADRVAFGALPDDLGEGRRLTAATLRAIDAAHGGGYYEVPVEAETESAAAGATFGGSEPVVDVQTHLVSPARWGRGGEALAGFLRMVDPDRWSDALDPHLLAASQWAAQVFGGSETAVALITALPGLPDDMVLPNDEIAVVREIVDRYSDTQRVLTHTIVHPNLGEAELDRMVGWNDTLRPSGWKVYTLWDPPEVGGGGFFLDDERWGVPFLERVRDVGPRLVCAHKGIAGPVPDATPAGASPRDVGPAAAAFPEIDFVVYHSGYDVDTASEEGAYEAGGRGVNRLVRSVADSGVGRGANVWAELGSTWFLMLRRPREAAHVIGKLLLAVGEDRILWGTDSIWYGPPQPLIDAFRAFTIPDDLRSRHGYPELTRAVKEKILSGNAARLYRVDPRPRDDGAWIAEAARALGALA